MQVDYARTIAYCVAYLPGMSTLSIDKLPQSDGRRTFH